MSATGKAAVEARQPGLRVVALPLADEYRDFEIASSDANVPPGGTGQRVNLTVWWFRSPGGQWRKTDARGRRSLEDYLDGFIDGLTAGAPATANGPPSGAR